MKSKLLLVAALSLGLCIESQAQLGGALKNAMKKTASVADQPTQGITSPSHTKYMNKVVFAGSEEGLAFGKENEAAFANKLEFGKPIFFRAYFDNSLSNTAQRLSPTTSREVINTHAQYRVKFYLDGALAYNGAIQADQLSDEMKSWTTFKGALQPAEDKSYLGMDLFKQFMTDNQDKLTTGDHKFKMEIAPMLEYPEQKEGNVLASGEMTLAVKANSIDPNNTSMCLPKAGMTDPKLEADILKAFKAKAAKDGWSEQPKMARIVDSKWTIIRNEITGFPIQRKISAIIVSTSKAGKCIYQDFGFLQDYDGSQYQNEVYLLGVGDQREINCKCISK